MLTLGLSGKIQIATGKDGYNRQGRKSLPCKGLTTTIDNKLLLTLELLQFALRAMSVEFSTIRLLFTFLHKYSCAFYSSRHKQPTPFSEDLYPHS
jgi:hypothetical protein